MFWKWLMSGQKLRTMAEQQLTDQITDKVDWAMFDGDGVPQVEAMIEVCVDLWLTNSRLARKLEASIVGIWGK